MINPIRELILNRNKVVVSWSGRMLEIIVNDSEPLCVDDIHAILRAVNDVRREKWEARNLKEDGTSSTLGTEKRLP